MSVLTSD
jgi:predicted dehydrogenase